MATVFPDPMRLRPNALSFRLSLTAAIWCLIVLALAAVALTSVYRQTAENAFDRELDLYVLNLIAVADISNTERQTAILDLGNPRFGSFRSGWFWQIQTVNGEVPLLLSTSLAREAVGRPPLTDVPLDGDFRRSYNVTHSDGMTSHVVERVILLEGLETAVAFLVGGAEADLLGQVDAFFRLLTTALAIVGIGLVIAMVLVVRTGLRPLRAIGDRLVDIREGRAEKIEGSYPEEIEPLALELNALIDANSQIVARARTQSGNLAHALKTPLTVLKNEATGRTDPLAVLATEQVETMRQQVDYHLNRARIAATSAGRARHLIDDSLLPIIRTLSKISSDRSIQVQMTGEEGLHFRGEREDFDEIVGNVLENAFKWAKSRVVVHRRNTQHPHGEIIGLELTISDNGPGVADADLSKIAQRGKRFDERVPGSGLGLSIVADLVELYDGVLSFSRAELGGLEVAIWLPTEPVR